MIHLSTDQEGAYEKEEGEKSIFTMEQHSVLF